MRQMNLGTMIALSLALATIATGSFAQPAPPQLSVELRNCERLNGVAAVQPVGQAPDGGFFAMSYALTPASAPGARTVNPRTASCLMEAMGSELLIMAAMTDEEGIRDAWAWPLSIPNTLTPQDEVIARSWLDLMTDRRDQPILVYCHHIQCTLSYNAVHHLRDLGYTNILWMREGIQGWREANLPVGLTRQGGAWRLPVVEPPTAVWTPQGDNRRVLSPDYASQARWRPLEAILIRRPALCYAAQSGSPAPPPGDGALRVVWMIETAAGVDYSVDNEVVARRKVQAFWARYGNILECGEDLQSISIFKWAVGHFKLRFIEYALTNWGLTPEALNKIDDYDGRTLLDYTEQFYNSGIDSQSQVLFIIRLLRANGAKTARELAAERGS